MAVRVVVLATPAAEDQFVWENPRPRQAAPLRQRERGRGSAKYLTGWQSRTVGPGGVAALSPSAANPFGPDCFQVFGDSARPPSCSFTRVFFRDSGCAGDCGCGSSSSWMMDVSPRFLEVRRQRVKTPNTNAPQPAITRKPSMPNPVGQSLIYKSIPAGRTRIT